MEALLKQLRSYESDICFQVDTKVFRTHFTNELYENLLKMDILLHSEITEPFSGQIMNGLFS